MPTLTTLRIRLPVWPFHSPLRTRSQKPAILSSTAWTSGTTFSPSTTIEVPFGARNATCKTARFSVMLIFSPLNMASIRSRRPAFLRQLKEQLEGFVGDTIFGVIEIETQCLNGQALAAFGVFRKELSKMKIADLLMVSLEGLPPRSPGK